MRHYIILPKDTPGDVPERKFQISIFIIKLFCKINLFIVIGDSEYIQWMDQADRSVIIQHGDRVEQLLSLCQTKGDINSFITFQKDSKVLYIS